MNLQERKNRIIARGEHSNHSHVVIGQKVTIEKTEDKTFINVEDTEAYIKHILESSWINEEKEVWTGEHKDIKLQPGRYEYIQQLEYDPFENIIRQVRD